MSRITRSALAALILATLVACRDESTSPSLTPVGARAAAAGNGRHIVAFSGNWIPSDFASRVQAMGGTSPRPTPRSAWPMPRG